VELPTEPTPGALIVEISTRTYPGASSQRAEIGVPLCAIHVQKNSRTSKGGATAQGTRLLASRSCVGLLLIALGLQLFGTDSVQAKPRPNVLVIVADDQRAMKSMRVMEATRRLFVQGGTSFRNAFATTPVCCPSRASIFTGQYAHNHGVRRNSQARKLVHDDTIQRYLQGAGYRTAIFGKFGGHMAARHLPYADKWAIFSRSQRSYRNGKWNVDGQTRTIRTYASEYIQRRAVRFIRQREARDRKPWLLYMAPPAPHSPFIPQRRYADRRYATWNGNPAVREGSTTDKPPYVRRLQETTLSDGRTFRLKQLRTLESVDDMIRGAFRTLRRKGETRRTLAILVSDNGLLWGEHKLSSKYHSYTQSIQIPLAIRWPGRVPRNATRRGLVGNIDIAPTILDATGISPEHTMDGRSLLKSWNRSNLFLEQWKTTSQVPTWKSLRSKRWQYTEYFDSNERRTFREYYNLSKDRWQLRNLLMDGSKRSGPNSDRLRSLHRRLLRAAVCSGMECP